MLKDNFSDTCLQADSCALAGAASFFAGIVDAAIVVNGPMWCYFYALRHIEDSQRDISKRMNCTQLDNDSIIFGAEGYLRETLEEIRTTNPAILCIETNCSASLIGDDVKAIAESMEFSCPIVVFDSGGMTGGFVEGYVKAAQTVLQSIELDKSKSVPNKKINLLGLSIGYYKGKEDTEELIRLLNLAGYEVNVALGKEMTFAQFRQLSTATLNIVLHQEIGLDIAKMLEEMYHIPYIFPSLPYGAIGTKNWLQRIQNALATKDLGTNIFRYLEIEENNILRTINTFKAIWGELWYDEVIVSAPPTMALDLSRALRSEWADTEKLTVVVAKEKDLLSINDKGKLDYIDEIYVADRDGDKIKKRFNEYQNGLIMASSTETRFFCRDITKERYFFPITNPVVERISLTNMPLMGISGAKFIQENLWNLLANHRLTGGKDLKK